ncbi:MAG: ABC transporter ATP-binding protein [Candidatus Krumholzibacteria bacterium]|nr:ABC transporter ATP-binding protein [Candidatus Krumholzibacteria bacterium]
MSILSADNVTKSFTSRKGEIEVLKGIDFEAESGEVVAILGASGAGKSTLLHVLGTLDTPDSGQVLIRGRDPFAVPDRELNGIRNRDLGFVFQFHYLLPEFDALENVMMPAVLRGDIGQKEKDRAAHLLEEVGLAERITHRPAELSGGEQQRVAVARALMNEPAIVLADEPSGNLDEANSEMLHGLILDLSRSKNQTFIVVTHKRELLGRADRGFVLEGGKLLEAGR